MFFQETQVFKTGGRSHFRIPSIGVTKDGYAIAFCNERLDTVRDDCEECNLAYAVKAPGQEWSGSKVARGILGWFFVIGSVVYDQMTDTFMCFFSRSCVSENEFGDYSEEEMRQKEEERRRIIKRDGIKPGRFILETKNNGETWTERPFAGRPLEYINRNTGKRETTVSSTHGSSAGIQLIRGPHAGRLLCPSRYAIGKYTSFDQLKEYSYNNTLYSDDHGQTWRCGGPVQIGTGEGTLIERSDGTILYNSRAYFFDQKRYLAVSRDGGETFGEFTTDDFLIEEKNIGCNASFLRVDKDRLPAGTALPKGCTSLTLFANPRAENRRNMTICYSFDEGMTWAGLKTVHAAAAGYSSLAYNEKDGRFYLLYENGDDQDPYENGISVAEFDTEWLLSVS